MMRLPVDGQHDLGTLIEKGLLTLLDCRDGHHAELDSASASLRRLQDYDSKDPPTDHAIAADP
jgi:hypothetical protein